jgi:hypothetical protein
MLSRSRRLHSGHCFQLPQPRSTRRLALQVVVVPGRIFSVHGRDPAFHCPWVRLAFCNTSDGDLREGAARLGRVLRRAAAEGQAADAGPAGLPRRSAERLGSGGLDAPARMGMPPLGT